MLKRAALVHLYLKSAASLCAVMELLFSEELGLVLEVSQVDVDTVCQRYSDVGVQCHRIGRTCDFGPKAQVRMGLNTSYISSTYQPHLE